MTAPEPPRATVSLRVPVVLGAGVGLVAAVVVVLATRSPVPPPATSAEADSPGDVSWVAGTRPAPDFALRDQEGEVVSLAEQRGEVVLVTFMNSRCREICPLDGRELGAVQAALPARDRPVILAISVNPAEDTAATARRAATRWRWSPAAWHWLMGTRAELAPVWRAYGIEVRPGPDDIAHSGALYVIDARGDQRAGFASPIQAPRVLQAVKGL